MVLKPQSLLISMSGSCTRSFSISGRLNFSQYAETGRRNTLSKEVKKITFYDFVKIVTQFPL